MTSAFCCSQLAFTKQLEARPEPSSSGVTITGVLSDQQKENLFVLARTRGFLKYYHPDVAKGSYNFLSCLFSILPLAGIAPDLFVYPTQKGIAAGKDEALEKAKRVHQEYEGFLGVCLGIVVLL